MSSIFFLSAPANHVKAKIEALATAMASKYVAIKVEGRENSSRLANTVLNRYRRRFWNFNHAATLTEFIHVCSLDFMSAKHQVRISQTVNPVRWLQRDCTVRWLAVFLSAVSD